MTKDVLEKYFQLYETLETLQKDFSDKLRTVQEQNGKNLAKVADTENKKKKIEVNERALWNEVKYLGRSGHRASDYLSEQYPYIFEMFDKEKELVEEIKKFEVETFGFDHTRMTMPNTLKMINILLDYAKGEK